MSQLFEIEGDDLDIGFMNLRAKEHRQEQQIVQALEQMWAQFEPYADPDYREAFARDPESRFWEMALGCSLLDAGKTLVPTADQNREKGHPDFCVMEGKNRIWIEAIAPKAGDDPDDGIPELVPLNDGGRVTFQPTRQVHLRITSALWTKKQVFERYIENGVVESGEQCIIAVGASNFGIHAGGFGHPLAVSAVFPIGNEYIRIDRESLEVVEQGHEHSPEIERAKGAIPRTAFMDEEFGSISGLIWSRVSIGNMSREARPLSYIHNPIASDPLSQRWGVWDREYVAEEGQDEWTITDILAV
jgi:hypothetical protein